MTDILTQPMTDHERSLILAGIEWMRAQAVAALPMDSQSFPVHLAMIEAADAITAIHPPTLQPTRIGILGEG